MIKKICQSERNALCDHSRKINTVYAQDATSSENDNECENSAVYDRPSTSVATRPSLEDDDDEEFATILVFPRPHNGKKPARRHYNHQPSTSTATRPSLQDDDDDRGIVRDTAAHKDTRNTTRDQISFTV